MSLEACPKCGADSIFVPLIPAVGYDGKLHGAKSEGFCNSHKCDQLLWYYPHSGLVTRRTVGRTLSEWRKQRVDLFIINIMRRHEGLLDLMEVGEPERAARALKAHRILLSSLRPWYTRLPDAIVNWFWYIVAAVKSPFLVKLPSGEVQAVKAGALTPNEARKLAMHSEDSDCHGEEPYGDHPTSLTP